MTFALTSRLMLAELFLISGTVKIMRSPSGHLAMLRVVFGTVGPWAQRLVRLLPSFELILGLWLSIGFAVPGAVIIAVGLLVVFTLVLLDAMRKGYAGPCMCFGATSNAPISMINIALNTIFIAGGLFSLSQCKRDLSVLKPVWQVTVTEAVVVMLSSLTLGSVYMLYRETEGFIREIRRSTGQSR